MEFNSSPGELISLSPLFSDDSRVDEAASIAQKLSKMNPLRIGISFLYPSLAPCHELIILCSGTGTNLLFMNSELCFLIEYKG